MKNGGHSSKAWYHGLDSGVTHINVSEGSTQGDVLGTLCYTMAIHAFLQGCSSTVEPVYFYIP